MAPRPQDDPDPEAPTPRWETACPLAELAPGSLRTFKRDGRQLVLVRTADGAARALDNRCPHEGYPLAQGRLEGSALTCRWHNWKFDVHDGRCLLGGEDVRAFPTRVSGGLLEVDLAEPPPERSFPAWRASLLEGIARRDTPRALRDATRLLQAGYEPWRLLGELAAHDGRHAEYGTTHVLPVAADLGRSLERYPGTRAAALLAPVIDLCSESNQRLPERALPPALPGADGPSLRAAVEDEDLERALGLLVGACEAGVGRATLEGWLYAALSDHFLDFGHELIYLVKGQELLAHAGDAFARDVYAGLLTAIVYGTREDTLPYMAPYAQRLRAVEGELEAVFRRARPDAPFRPQAVHEALLDGRSADALDAVWSALQGGVPAERVARALVAAAAERLLRFDDAHERDPEVAENWLWATHRFTFASAVRNAVERFRTPDALRFLFQAVMFVHSGRAMDLPPERRVEPPPEPADADGVLAAVRAREPWRAVARARGYLAAGSPPAALEAGLLELCLHGRFVRPIFEAHGIKTTVAAFEEHAARTDEDDRALPVRALVRFLASPVVERDLQATVETSIAWVAHGRVPRKLTQ